MSFGSAYLDDEFLTGGVMPRRCVAWLIDVCLIALLTWVLWWLLVLFGLLTFGLGFGAMVILPFVPFFYSLLSLLGMAAATPGQWIMGLTVRRNDDLAAPTALQAFVMVLLYTVTLATWGLLLVVALFTVRHRTLHDILSGLVVVRTQALTAEGGSWNMYGGTPAP